MIQESNKGTFYCYTPGGKPLFTLHFHKHYCCCVYEKSSNSFDWMRGENEGKWGNKKWYEKRENNCNEKIIWKAAKWF